jgi:hypothetical protein
MFPSFRLPPVATQQILNPLLFEFKTRVGGYYDFKERKRNIEKTS